MSQRAVFLPYTAEFPSASFPQLMTIHPTERRPVLAFDGTASEYCYFTFITPSGLSGTPCLLFSGVMATGVSGSIVVGAAIEAITNGDTSPSPASGTSFSASNGLTAGVPASLLMFQGSVVLTNNDSMTAGDYTRLKLWREPGDAGDTATGDWYFLEAELKDGA